VTNGCTSVWRQYLVHQSCRVKCVSFKHTFTCILNSLVMCRGKGKRRERPIRTLMSTFTCCLSHKNSDCSVFVQSQSTLERLPCLSSHHQLRSDFRLCVVTINVETTFHFVKSQINFGVTWHVVTINFGATSLFCCCEVTNQLWSERKNCLCKSLNAWET